MIRNIIWDFDGTLFDTYPAITRSFQAALNQNGFTASPDWIESLAKQSLGTCADTLAAHFNLDPVAFGQAFQTSYGEVLPEAQPPFPGVIKVCQRICSTGGNNLIVTHRGRKSMLKLLDAYELTPSFVGFVTNDDGYPKKPDPTAFTAILHYHGLSQAETLAVGDRDIDILAGRDAELTTCLYGNKVVGCTADINIKSYEELFEYLACNSWEAQD